jgi:hypothetical protein
MKRGDVVRHNKIERLTSNLGHLRPGQPALPTNGSPVCTESDLIVSRTRNVAMGHNRTHAPQRVADYSITSSALSSIDGGTVSPS